MLSFLSNIYGRIVDSRNRRFDEGDTAVVDIGVRTISVGNITTGGTGKTPVTIRLAELLAGRGKRVGILTRGYGRHSERQRVVVSDGRKVLADAATGGDEPVMMAARLIGKAVVIADADRASAGEWAAKEFGINVFVLDDGFQHRRVRRDLDIVCIDALDPFGDEKLLPKGRLREPLEGLARASFLLVNRAETAARIRRKTRAEILAEISMRLAEYAPGIPVIGTTTRFARMTPLDRYLAGLGVDASSGYDIGSMANKKGFAFCGLGRPEAFFEKLRADNFELAGKRAFADHHRYSRREIAGLVREAQAAGADYLLTTAKDAVKLAAVQPDMACFVVEVDLVIDDERGFATMI